MSNGSNDVLILQVTADASMLHTRECPHLEMKGLSALVPATVDQIDALPICSSCRGILDGGRRTAFSDFEAAMEALPVPLENRTRMRQISSGLSFSQIWSPPSRSYIAVADAPGSAAAAYFNKGFVDVRRPAGGYDRELLPTHGLGGGKPTSVGVNASAVCPTCHTQLPATGMCDDCDS